ncbi:nucleoporin Nup188 isoform X2 [Diabrotica virgifera virgifera]|uniref:Uncharacterized protein LOC114325434 isoform X2 n=1 Tax=Diabrotica virgifera virgifera TaxID=50390 RepID=A0A6P7F1V1_DIAVI|nr:nucleoporin Nup188 isoform X2 [Diabrotica virgifera virgifera]
MSLTIWMRVYPIIGPKEQHVGEHVVKEVMDICKKHITDVLQMYRPYTREAFILWRDTCYCKEIVEDDEMCNFVHTLSRRMNLCANQTWDTICNFLVYEYHGKRDELKNIIRFNSKLDILIERIWDFYSLERLFLVKTLRHILENADNKFDRHYKKFQAFLSAVDMSKLWKMSVQSFKELTKEISKQSCHLVTEDLLKEWIHRNNREQVEMVFILMDILPRYKLVQGDIEKFLSICIRHFFGRAPLYPDSLKISRKDDLLEIKNAEIVLVLALFEKVWRTPELWKKFEPSLEEMLDFLKRPGNDDIVFYTWSLFKFTTRENTDREKRGILVDIEQVLKKNVFKSLYKVMKHKMFQGTKAEILMADAVNFLLNQSKDIYSDYQAIYEQEGIPEILSVLVQVKGVANVEIFQSIYKSALDCFPYMYEPFLELSKSLLSSPEKCASIVVLLKRLPTFLTENAWISHENSSTLKENLQLFTDSKLFMIPYGTLIERFRCRDTDLVQLKYSFSFFLLLEQHIKSLHSACFGLTPPSVFKKLKKLVVAGYEFIHHYLKEYKGDYKKDPELRTLVARLHIVPARFCEGEKMDYELILLYFSIHSTLVKQGFLDFMEAFPIDHRKKFMPVVPHYNRDHKDTLFWQISSKSYLIQALKEEEIKDTHPLLVEYLEFLNYIVKNGRYAMEVQLPGVWFIIYSPYLFHERWNYKDRREKVTISRLCCSVLVEVLQKQLITKDRESDIIFDYVLDIFFTDSSVATRLLRIITKERSNIQNAMLQEINWNDGPGEEYLECLKLHIVLAFLLYKHKSAVEHKKNYLDENVGDFAKAVISYIVNPFSLPLRSLSCKFLELIAKDPAVPLLSMLGLDMDQVQRIFLERLRDATEDDGFKCLLLDLIGTCLFNQGAMTAAFFNFKRFKKWYTESSGDEITLGPCVTDFMIESLLNLKNSKDPRVLKSPLQIGILHIMANLWVTRSLNLVTEAIKLPQFWQLLCYPLFKEFVQSFRVYGYIFRILAVQLLQSLTRRQELQFLQSLALTQEPGTQEEEQIDEEEILKMQEHIEADQKLFQCVERFLKTKHQIQKWTDFFFATFKNCSMNLEDIEERHYFLKSWMEFFVVLERKEELPKLDKEHRQVFLCKSLDAVQYPMVNNYCLKLWMDLLLLQFAFWKQTELEDVPIVAGKAMEVIGTIAMRYRYEHHTTRLSILSVIQKMLEILRKHFEVSSGELERVLEFLGPIIEIEYTVVHEYRWHNEYWAFDIVTREPLLPWMLCITIVNDIFLFKNIDEVSYWFSYVGIIPKYTYCISEFLKHASAIPLVKLLFHGLALYASSKIGFDFLNFDFNRFFMKIEVYLYSLLYGDSTKVNPLVVEEAWSITSSLFQLITACCKNMQGLAISKIYIFLNLAEKLFEYVFGMVGTTVALRALDLIISMLMLFDTLQINWSVDWYRKSNGSYAYLLNGIKKVINGCLYAILRPKNIMVYVIDITNHVCMCDHFPMELMIAIVNRLMTAVGLGCSILYRVNAGLIDLMTETPQIKIEVMIENDFSVPKFELPVTSNLTYGMLLCLAHFMCKTLEAIRQQGPPKNQEGTEDTPITLFTRVYGMVQHEGFSDSYPTQQLSAFLRYAMYEYTGLADPWTLKLDYNRVKTSLESLMMFLGQQIFLTINIAPFDNESFFKFRKNLHSELQFFYEHVKKITSLILTESNATPGQFEMDVLKKYLLYCKETGQYNKIIDTNFCIVLSNWFIGISKLK